MDVVGGPPAGSGDDGELRHVLTEIRRRGGFGTITVDAVIETARRYVAVLPPGPAVVVDLGSGGGIPGLVIAVDRPDLQLTLVERRGARADLLRYAVRALRIGARVRVDQRDAQIVAQERRGTVDIVTALLFAGPAILFPVAGALLRPDGVLIVTDPPAGSGGPPSIEQVSNWGFQDEMVRAGVHRYRRS